MNRIARCARPPARFDAGDIGPYANRGSREIGERVQRQVQRFERAGCGGENPSIGSKSSGARATAAVYSKHCTDRFGLAGSLRIAVIGGYFPH
ncbi:hypothetical protein ABEV74_04015 [Paenibacillus cisolokensis]|uniref:hypothetical protein n=1 Tax=Paenibacillus cisolokensis TaxID=1658519 RepID=UPI003D288B99